MFIDIPTPLFIDISAPLFIDKLLTHVCLPTADRPSYLWFASPCFLLLHMADKRCAQASTTPPRPRSVEPPATFIIIDIFYYFYSTTSTPFLSTFSGCHHWVSRVLLLLLHTGGRLFFFYVNWRGYYSLAFRHHYYRYLCRTCMLALAIE